MKRLLLRWHLGVGDALLCNGLVRVLVERGHNLILPCYPHNIESVKAMFSDLGEAVVTVNADMPDLQYDDFRQIAIGYEGKDFDPTRFDASFYAQAGVPFLAKWEKFKIPVPQDYIVCDVAPKNLIHDDERRNFVIDNENIHNWIRIGQQNNFFVYLDFLRKSENIHCINSSVAILADLINAPGKKYLHRYSRPDGGAMPIWGREWEIIDKPL